MKRGVLLLAITLVLSSFYAQGAASYNGTTSAKINLQTTNGVNNYLSASDFNGTSQGTKSNTSYFHIKAAEAWVNKNNSSDITGGNFHYRIYKQGATPGAFTQISFTWQEENTSSGTVYQRWGNYGIDIDVLASVNNSGTWVFECYWSSPTNGVNCSNPIYLNNGGSNYSFTFTADASLPVELTKFTASSQSNSIQLDWQTATEQDNSHFEIEKSTNGEAFERIGTVEGFGTTTEIQNYAFIDENPLNGQNYYRLKQVDYNGDFEYSDVVVAEFSKRGNTSFYPNPARDALIIESDIEEAVSIQIYNLQGQLLKQFNDVRLNDQHQMNISDLTNGVYQLQLISTNSFELLQQHRLIKQ